MGKNLVNSYKGFDSDKDYSIAEAIKLVKELSFEKFDPSIEVSFNLNLNVKKAEEQLRGSIVLPHGVGKVQKMLVIVDQDQHEAVKNMGADYVGDLSIMTKVERENWFDFDYIVTVPEMMPKLAKYGKLLGPKGLMPNPKLGTVTTNIEKTISDIKKGQMEYRTNDNGLVNVSFGKKSFTEKQLIENYDALFKLIKSKRPSTVKGEYIKGISISSTMGPGIRVMKG